MMETRFVVTPWQERAELLELRRLLYGSVVEWRKEAVNKILAWRARKLELPLLLESTADIVDAVLQDERGRLGHNVLRMVYATAISRFVTGLSDTQSELTRNPPTWFAPTQTLHFPLALRETRHCIVHRHLPSLAELKRAAKESLDWLWEWYWSHLDAAFASASSGGAALTERELRDRLQGVLKSYVKERKGEIKKRGKGVELEMKAAESAVASHLHLDGPRETKEGVLLELLADERAILPADKKMRTSMSGAFLVWTPFLLALCKAVPGFLRRLLDRMVASMASLTQETSILEMDPKREGMYEWCSHILSSSSWKQTQQQPSIPQRRNEKAWLFDHILGLCFTTPTFWTLKLAETLLSDESLPTRDSWLVVLQAARAEDTEMEGLETAAPPAPSATDETVKATVPKLRGPQKRVGLWRPLPIGVPCGGE
ncbi:Las1-domain-containing protein [Lentithecium fluviatile CBS 122367]|uniref:Las1-domain-containing protein n=1 Tax=Lentithecium fluviatile CBS 122367 TaxID=1168545 RepID=A0A6G1ITH9_9PLEO|nr:Las1-domain-containing protein [Lentithecium fluviatile CBS 122367]